MNITWKGADSSNYTEGRQGNSIAKIVVHWIVGRLEAADSTFQNPARNASAHYGVGDNDIHQYVEDEDTAWHCGDWLWNLKTIGIEHEGGPDIPISEDTYKSSADLIKSLCETYDIPLDKEHILPHNHFVATQCPGTLDIDKLISLAKGDSMSNCEEELQEMRVSRNHWKAEVEKLEVRIETERTDHAKEVASKQKIIDDQQRLVSEISQINTTLMKDKGDMQKTIDIMEKRYLELSDKHSKNTEVVDTLTKGKRVLETKIEALEKQISGGLVEITFWEFIKSRFAK